MNNLERKVDLLIDLLIAEDEDSRKTAIEAVKSFRALEPSIRQEDEVELIPTKIDEIFRHIGIPTSLLGYEYLKECVVLVIENPDLIHAVTKELYPTVAKNNKTTASRVERAIRHAIEVAWNRGDADVLSTYFGYTVSYLRGKPTNQEFISQIALHIKRLIKI